MNDIISGLQMTTTKAKLPETAQPGAIISNQNSGSNHLNPEKL